MRACMFSVGVCVGVREGEGEGEYERQGERRREKVREEDRREIKRERENILYLHDCKLQVIYALILKVIKALNTVCHICLKLLPAFIYRFEVTYDVTT